MNDNQKYALNLLKTGRGQIEAVIAMLENNRYCIDISTQILAVQGLLKKANTAILKQHMEHCVSDAIASGGGQEKIDEVIKLLETMGK